MHEGQFDRLCEGVCALMGHGAAGSIGANDALRMFRLRVDSLAACFLLSPDSNQQATLIIECGEFRMGCELQGWLDLLNANHATRGDMAPRFARNPESGGVILSCAFDPSSTSATQLHSTLSEMLRMARGWRAQHCAEAS